MSTKRFKNLFRKICQDQSGGEVIEYALIAGLIVIACIALITALGTKVFARWNSINQRL